MDTIEKRHVRAAARPCSTTMGLAAALDWHARNFSSERGGIAVAVRAREPALRPALQVESRAFSHRPGSAQQRRKARPGSPRRNCARGMRTAEMRDVGRGRRNSASMAWKAPRNKPKAGLGHGDDGEERGAGRSAVISRFQALPDRGTQLTVRGFPADMTIRVLIADDHGVVGRRLTQPDRGAGRHEGRRLGRGRPRGRASNDGEQSGTSVLMDIGMPVLNGTEADAGSIRRAAPPGTRVVMLSAIHGPGSRVPRPAGPAPQATIAKKIGLQGKWSMRFGRRTKAGHHLSGQTDRKA